MFNTEGGFKHANKLHKLFVIQTVVSVVISLLIIIGISIILVLLATKVRRRCRAVSKKLRITQKIIKDHISPSLDEFLAVLVEIGMKEDKAKEILTRYDSQRREIVEKEMRFKQPEIQKFSIFNTFFNETAFMKGGGFRWHREMHVGRQVAYEDEEKGRTILPTFDFVKTPIKKVIVSDEGPSVETSSILQSPQIMLASSPKVSIEPSPKVSPEPSPKILSSTTSPKPSLISAKEKNKAKGKK